MMTCILIVLLIALIASSGNSAVIRKVPTRGIVNAAVNPPPTRHPGRGDFTNLRDVLKPTEEVQFPEEEMPTPLPETAMSLGNEMSHPQGEAEAEKPRNTLPIQGESQCRLYNRTVVIRKKYCEDLTLHVQTCRGMCESYVKIKRRFPYLQQECFSCQPSPGSISTVSGVQICGKRSLRLVKVTLPTATACSCQECLTRLQLNSPANRERI